MERAVVRPTPRLAALVVGLAASVSLAVVPAPVAPAAGAQDSGAVTDPQVTVEVESVTPWVEPDAEWSTQLRVTGAPPDARISYSIRQPPTGSEADVRSSLIAGRNGDDEQKVMRSPVTQDLAPITTPDGITTLSVRIRPGSGPRDRILIPNSGAYPVVVTVTSSGGTTLGRVSLSLNRLPDGEDRRRPLGVGVLVSAPRADAFDDEGRATTTPALRASIESLVDRLEAVPEAPVRVDVGPESLVALTESDEPGATELVDRLRAASASATVMGVPWADLHLEGWATSGSLPEVQTSVVDGQQAAFVRLQRPVDSQLWPTDRTLGPTSVRLLTRLGVEAAVFEPDRLEPARPPGGETGFTRPFRVAGPDDTAITGLELDPELQELLESGDDHPALSAHQIVTQLFAAWLTDDHERGAVLRAGPETEPETLAALTVAMRAPASGGAPLDFVDPAAVADLPVTTSRSSGRDVPFERRVVAVADLPQISALADRLRTARPLVDDYTAIMPTGDPVAARHAIVTQRSLDRDLDPAAMTTLLDATVADMTADLARITASKPRSLTLTSRNTFVPLRFTNDTGREVRVRLKLQSPRLAFPDGDVQTLTLQPGVNRFDVDVDVRASGQFVLQAELVAPDSDRVLASTRQRIRSQTFSGVGLMLSGGALFFLVVWWSRTLRRRDRDAETDEGDTDAAPDAGDPSVAGASH